MEFNLPTTKEELEQLARGIVEIDDDDLDAVAGGNDDLKAKGTKNWTCPYCGTIVACKSSKDAAKHMTTACPNNPLK